MKKTPTPDQPGSGPSTGDGIEEGDEHVLLQIVGLLGDAETSANKLDALSQKARAHLETCSYCRLGIALLNDMFAPALLAEKLLAEPEIPAQEDEHPSLEDQVRYASIASLHGTSFADEQMPQVAQHRSRCSSCAELIADLIDDDAEDDDEVDPPGARANHTHSPSNSQDASSALTPAALAGWRAAWRAQSAHERVLLAAYKVAAADLTVSITSALPYPRIMPESKFEPSFRDTQDPFRGVRGPSDVESDSQDNPSKGHPAQSFTVDLSDEPQVASWIRVKVYLQAEATGSLICCITASRVVSAADIGVPISGVRWLVERLTPAGTWKLLAGGETAIDQPSGAKWEEQGEMRLIIEASGRKWIVPLLIRGPQTYGGATLHSQGQVSELTPPAEEKGRQRMGAQRPLRLTDFTTTDVTVQKMGRGGFGLVFMGPDQGRPSGKWSALKTLRPELVALRPQLNELFVTEGLTWVGLWPHANLLTAQSVTEIDARLYLILDYAKYGSLRELLTFNQPLAIRLLWAQMIAAGLVALHTPDPEMLRPDPLVHRDLKPENVLVDEHGYAQITDFGLAATIGKAVRDAPEILTLVEALAAQDDAQAQPTAGQRAVARSTRTTRYQSRRTRKGGLGTMAYMPPEQWGEEDSVGPPADLYAFGLILSELLAGWHGLVDLEQELDEEGWYRLHKSGAPRPLRSGPAEGASQLPQEAEDLYQRLLSKRATDRPTAAVALRVLQQAAAQVGEQPYSVSEAYARTVEHRLFRWHNWAVTYFNFGRYEEALTRNERALELAPEDVAVLLTRGNISGRMGLAAVRAGQEAEGRRLQEEALTWYAKGLAVAPADDISTHKEFHTMRGARLNEMRRYGEAEEEYIESLRLMPESARTWFNRANNALAWGQAEEVDGRPEEARRLFQVGLSHIEQAIRHAPNDPDNERLRNALQQALRES